MIDPVDVVEAGVEATKEIIEAVPEIIETSVDVAVEVVSSVPEIVESLFDAFFDW